MLPEPTIRAETGNVTPPAMSIAYVPLPAYSCDAEGRITAYNERAAALWGRRPKLNDAADRFCGSAALLGPDGSPVPRDACPTALVLATGTPAEGAEAVVVRPDGIRRSVLYYAAPLRSDRNQLIGANVLLIDVTEREEAQRIAREELQGSEATFRSFFDSVAVGVALVRVGGRYLNVNDRYCEITRAIAARSC